MQSQLTGSLSNVVYISSRVSACRKSPDNTSNAGGLEFEIEDKILGLLTEAADKVDIKAIKQKGQRQAKPIKDIDRVAISRL